MMANPVKPASFDDPPLIISRIKDHCPSASPDSTTGGLATSAGREITNRSGEHFGTQKKKTLANGGESMLVSLTGFQERLSMINRLTEALSIMN